MNITVIRCPICGTEFDWDDEKCPKCGTVIDG